MNPLNPSDYQDWREAMDEIDEEVEREERILANMSLAELRALDALIDQTIFDALEDRFVNH